MDLIIEVYNQYFINLDSQRWKYVGYQYWSIVGNRCCTNAGTSLSFRLSVDSRKLVSNVWSTLVRLLTSAWVISEPCNKRVLTAFEVFILDDPSPRFHQQRRHTYFLRSHVYLLFLYRKTVFIKPNKFYINNYNSKL